MPQPARKSSRPTPQQDRESPPPAARIVVVGQHTDRGAVIELARETVRLEPKPPRPSSDPYRDGKRHIGGWYEHDGWTVLHRLCARYNRSKQEMIAEALNLLMAEAGESYRFNGSGRDDG